MEGVIIVDKPKGMTSHDVVDYVRRRFGIKRVGHAGTLDPFATGVLLILIGRYTKSFNRFLEFDKEYEAVLTLGAKTSTADITGEVIEQKPCPPITQEEVERVLALFNGELMQVPPMTSALKHKGKPLYYFARKGISIVRKPRNVKIRELKLLNFIFPEIRFYVKCSSGTYIRSLGEELAERLGCFGHLTQLSRLSVGPYSIEQAVPLEQIEEKSVIR